MYAKHGQGPGGASWLGENAVRELVPDQRLRVALEAETPRLPLSYCSRLPPTVSQKPSIRRPEWTRTGRPPARNSPPTALLNLWKAAVTLPLSRPMPTR